jgi:hypothetical protein
MHRRWSRVLLAVAGLAGGVALWVAAMHATDVTTVLRYGSLAAGVANSADACIARGHAMADARDDATKVVPIFDTARGETIGTAQVIGARAIVSQVQSVAARPITQEGIEGIALIPIRSRTPTQPLDEVKHVGIGGIAGNGEWQLGDGW